MKATAFRTVSSIALSMFALCQLSTAQDAPKTEERGRKEAFDNVSRRADEERLTRMKREIGELQRAGKHEEAERLAKELESAFKRRQWEGEKHAVAEGPEKLQHLQEAIKHLRAAGLHEPARDLEQAAAKLREQLEHREQPDRKEGGDLAPVREMHRQMQEMREQMQKMNQELQQMREQLQRERERANRQ